MKKLNLVFLLTIGLIFSSQSFAATVMWDSGAANSLNFGADITSLPDVSLADSALAVATNLDSGSFVSYYFNTLQELTLSLVTSASGLNLNYLAELKDGNGNLIASDGYTGGTDISFGINILELLGQGTGFVYTITNNSASMLNVTSTLAIASTPIPAALLLFGTAFAGLFGVKSYKSKKMAA